MYTEEAVMTDTDKERDVINKVNEILKVFWVIYKAWIWVCSLLNCWRVVTELLIICWANALTFKVFSEVFSECFIELRWELYWDRVATRWKRCLKLLVFQELDLKCQRLMTKLWINYCTKTRFNIQNKR